MTAIIGIRDVFLGTVWLGCDSGVTSDDDTGDLMPSHKIFASTTPGVNIVMGVTGNLRMMQVMRHCVMPKIEAMPDVTMSWLVRDLYHMVYVALTEFAVIEGDEPFNMHGCMLIGVRERLFQIDNQFEVVENMRGYDAIGTGRQVALGSLYETQFRHDMTPELRVYRALAAASAHIPHIKPPFSAIDTYSRTYSNQDDD